MKKLIIILILAALVTGSVFAQSNWISGEASILGGGARYERMLTPNISIGPNIYFSSLIFWNDFAVDFSFRYYFSKIFFIGGALGFHWAFSWAGAFTDIVSYGGGGIGNSIGAAITPEVGWKIDVGAPGKFFIQPGIKIPLTFGVKPRLTSYWWDDETSSKSSFGFAINFVPYIGLGYAF